MIRVFLAALALAATGCEGDDDDTGPVDVIVPDGQVAVNPTRVDLGTLDLFEQSSAEITVTNSGAGPLQLYDVIFSDDRQRAHWTVEGPTSAVLAPGDTNALTVTAIPISIGDIDVQLHILSDDPTTPEVSVSLAASAEGVPDGRVEPTSVDVGSVAVGGTLSAEVVIANDGSADLQILSVTLSPDGTDWSLGVDPTGTAVPPNSESGRAIVDFTPTAAGVAAVNLLIETNDPDEGTISVSLVGTGA